MSRKPGKLTAADHEVSTFITLLYVSFLLWLSFPAVFTGVIAAGQKLLVKDIPKDRVFVVVLPAM